MALEVEKKKNAPEALEEKSKGVNIFLWLLTVVIIAVTAFGNIYFQDQYSTPIRVVAVVVLLLISLGVAATTNQGRKALGFFKDSRTELRKSYGQPVRKQRKQRLLLLVSRCLFH